MNMVLILSIQISVPATVFATAFVGSTFLPSGTTFEITAVFSLAFPASTGFIAPEYPIPILSLTTRFSGTGFRSATSLRSLTTSTTVTCLS